MHGTLGFFKRGTRQSISYSGTESYRYVESLFRASKGIDIITPYMGVGYAKLLASHAKQGKRIRIILAKGQASNSAAIQYLRPGVHARRISIALSAISFFAFLLAYMYGMPYTSVLFLFAFLGFTVLALAGKNRSLPIEVRYAPGFVHEKIYIGDKEAIAGSANLTYSGMHKNTEYIEIIKDAGKISGLEKHFNMLWHGSSNT